MDIDKLKKAYESALTHYNLPDFETFLKDMEDEEKQAKFLESLAKHYSVPDFETFQSDMGLKKKTIRRLFQQLVQILQKYQSQKSFLY